MNLERKQAMAGAFIDVFEKFAFMFAETVEREEILCLAVQRGLAAEMAFRGPLRGRLELAAPAQACPEIAANLLGMDPGDEAAESRGLDALKEMLNVACGNILTAIAGPEPVFDLSVPETREIDSAQWAEMAACEDTIPFLVDDTPMLLRMALAG